MVLKLSVGLLCFFPGMLAFAGPEVLFNGRNLDGWSSDIIDPKVSRDAVWSVSAGLLVCKGKPPGVLRSTKEYANYELNVEWRWAPGGKAGNSGVLIHASKPREIFVWPKSIEVQLGSENAGDFWMIGEKVTVEGSTPLGRRWLKRQESTEEPPGEWNAMRIRCECDRVTVWVNGICMNEGTGLSATKGAICL